MTHKSAFSRRELLGLFGVGSAFGGVVKASEPPPARSLAHNIVFMVADGMSTGIPSLAEPFSYLLRGRGTRWAALAREPRTARGWCDTASLNSLVTDSSAASSAWGSGSRVFNGTVNVLPDGTRLTPIGVLAHQSGRRVGLVTTTTITHATPAGFVAVQPSRDDEAAIASQYLNAVDVLLGGGRQFFDARLRSDRRDVLGDFRRAGYEFCDTSSSLAALTRPRRLLGLFADSHIPYVIDRNRDGHDSVPALKDMTTKALDALHHAKGGFLLQVEGGRVDHAAHANDGAGALMEMLAFDDAVGVVLDYAQKRNDTLVVITSDHGNANPGLNGIGPDYADSTKGLERLLQFKASSGVVLRRLQQERDSAGIVTAARASEIVRDLCGLSVSSEDAAALGAVAGKRLPTELSRDHASALGLLAEVLGNYTGLGWTGMSHTADFTTVLATGPGQERFAGLHHHTDTFAALTGLLGIKFVNPSMSPEQAARYTSTPQQEESLHWL